MNPNDHEAIGRVLTERDSQDEKWGANRSLPNRTWLAILVEEVGEVAKADLDHEPTERVVDELAQAAAVAVAWMAMMIRDSEGRQPEPGVHPEAQEMVLRARSIPGCQYEGPYKR
jgi:NTP pyrophosphatase (non-canonical NTP hydrolase)